MATAGLLDQDQLSCPICLDLLNNPVTILCGHSYCMGCINGYWDQDEHVDVYSCPQCRQTFTPRPVLGRNTMLAEVVEKLKTGLQAASPAQCYAGPGDVACDVCTGRKLKAVKSCLECLSSYCKTDLILHEKLNRGKAHKLAEATGKLQGMICSHHAKLLEVYCRTDQQCICYQCVMDKHRGHETVSAAAERTEKQNQLQATKWTSQQRIQEREKELQDLRQAVESLKHSAQTAVEESEEIFTELISFIETRRSVVKELIREQEKAAVSRAEGLLARLEQEIAELRRRDAELEQLSHTDNHIDFLQCCQALIVPPVCEESPRITIDPDTSFGFMRTAVSDLKVKLQDLCKRELVQISKTVKCVNIAKIPELRTFFEDVKGIQIAQPRTRAEFLQYSCQLSLEPNTAYNKLHLTKGNRVTLGTVVQSYPDHPERFEVRPQILCREGLSGRCYWEFEWNGEKGVEISVSYKEICRKGWGDDCLFGFSKTSWSFVCFPSGYIIWHDKQKLKISAPRFSRIGVYLDHRAGILSFYGVSDTMTLVHRVKTTFTKPLYPGFGFGLGSTIKLCSL
ncbi:tripartite motif-containing protein 16-like isoform X1 [Anguilla rostrata]|uniref:tripartite motif-containing protein 16-like isoform X1 n=1 Tax=Anguilla rostrata TaxID=7938 RepID=UPI0030D2F2CE